MAGLGAQLMPRRSSGSAVLTAADWRVRRARDRDSVGRAPAKLGQRDRSGTPGSVAHAPCRSPWLPFYAALTGWTGVDSGETAPES